MMKILISEMLMRKDIKEAELAEILGVEPKIISSWKGLTTTYPALSQVERMCQVFQCEIEDLVSIEKIKLDLNLFPKIKLRRLEEENLQLKKKIKELELTKK